MKPAKKLRRSDPNPPATFRFRPTAALLLTGVLASLPALSSTIDIYVDPTQGLDRAGCGRQTTPCNSIWYAVTAVSQPGDDIHLRRNTNYAVNTIDGIHVFHNLSFHGADATVIDANGTDRHFRIDSGATVSFNDIVLKNGLSSGTGGSIHVSNADLELSNTVFENNEAKDGGAVWIEDGTLLSEASEFTNNRALPGNGGAIYCLNTLGKNSGSLDIFDSKLNLNSAQREGGGITTRCETTIRRSDFFDNSANLGGAIHASMSGDDTLDIRRAQFSGNSSDSSGGAIRVEGGATDIRRSSFNENTGFDGGGISYVVTISAAVEDLSVVNSTFSANTARNRGGAINATSGEIHFVTMVDNWADSGNGLDIMSTGSFGINNSLINHDPSSINPNNALLCDGANLFAGAGNLIDNDSCGVNVLRVGVHNYSALESLDYNGGRTLSHKLNGNSSALDMATNCNGPNGLNKVDQRGAPRPESGGADCDIGAFERQ